tara:strand:- start:2906 stop:3082 length:177 start_codon:yes stop_codon:yes gene_type:complete
MNTVLAALTIVTIAICGPGKNIVDENLIIKKNTNSVAQKTITYKKVPTKWVKTPKKSN